MLKKIAYRKEPKLKVHKYVVAVNCRKKFKGRFIVHTKYFYCLNLKEVKERANSARVGSWIDVFKSDSNFIQAYAKEK